MITVFCHECRTQSEVDTASWSGICTHCNGRFVEELPQQRVRRPGGQRGGARGAAGGAGATAGAPHPAAQGGISQFSQLLSTVLSGDGAMARAFMEAMVGDDAAIVDALASRLMDEYEPATRPTASRVREALPMYVVRPAGATGEPAAGEACICAGEPCVVCHDEFKAAEMVVELPCSHGFHCNCLLPWLTTHHTCPVCRIELPEEGT